MGKDKEKTMYIGNVTKRLRKAKGMSQEKLALDSGLDRSFYGEIERNEKTPSLDTTFRIAWGLGMEPEELVKEIKESIAPYDLFGDGNGDK
ncbi:helix-turn-helix domain-containing protein [Bacillus sp. USDA818B3_A]|uniref:helix-turn-helix domain-containing protein n=1 Tax=Bacillus sp. USDA818B3_A TaxID=2698834 RepID=UPI00136946BA|nr:helix-turn-helix transcriptional regulator [Bacillus sp. USDA818B3_A]